MGSTTKWLEELKTVPGVDRLNTLKASRRLALRHVFSGGGEFHETLAPVRSG